VQTKKKILIVDDDARIVKLIKLNVEHAGYRTVTASNGVEALGMIEQESPDLLVLDFMMPKMDGMETLKRLRFNPATHYLPIIMLTARAGDQDVMKGYSYGADLYLTKPVDPAMLLSYIGRLLEQREAEVREDDVYEV
jgi:two-component system alkaline phosphatase synthesis response regulator PhoP/two-component system response regulator VicR